MNEDRRLLWESYTGVKPPYIEHAWINYNRYHEADNIIRILEKRGDILHELKVLDFGCGVGDYGYQFGRRGAEVTFFDLDEEIDFLKYRIANEQINASLLVVNKDNPLAPLAPKYDVVIFGEVLEHLDDPLETIKDAISNGAKYIFTSSYPYRSDDPNDSYWHHRGHSGHTKIRELQPPCREALNMNYNFVKFDGEARLWIRK